MNRKLLSIMCKTLSRGMLKRFTRLQTPATRTTENSNWDLIDEKDKLNFGEKAQWDETRNALHVFKQTWSVTHSPFIEKELTDTITIIPWKEHIHDGPTKLEITRFLWSSQNILLILLGSILFVHSRAY